MACRTFSENILNIIGSYLLYKILFIIIFELAESIKLKNIKQSHKCRL